MSRNIDKLVERLAAVEQRLTQLERASGIDIATSPKLHRRVWDWMQKNPAAAVLTAVFGIVASPIFTHWYEHRGDSERNQMSALIDAKLGPVTEHLNKVDGRLATLEGTVNTLKPFLQDLLLTDMFRAASLPQPAFQKNLPRLTSTINSAIETKAPVGTTVLHTLANKLLADGSSEAWSTTTSLLNYASLLKTSSDLQAAQQPLQSDSVTRFLTPAAPNGREGKTYALGTVLQPNVPEMHLLGSADLNASVNRGPAFFLVAGADVALDGQYVKRVIFKDSHIIYRGGPLQMSNVYFVNCTFEVQQKPAGVTLARAILDTDKGADVSISS